MFSHSKPVRVNEFVGTKQDPLLPMYGLWTLCYNYFEASAITLKHLLFLNWITLIFQREKETQILPSFLVDQVCILLYFLPWITRQVNANLDNVSFWFHLSKKKTLEVAIYLGPSVDEK